MFAAERNDRRYQHKRNAAIAAAVADRSQPLQVIADRYGITRERVRQIAARHDGTVRGPRYDALDPSKIAAARDLVNQGMCVSHAATEVGLLPDSLRRRLVHEGLVLPTPRDELRREWTKQEDALLRATYDGRKRGSVRILCVRLGRPRNSIIGRARRLGLSQPFATVTQAWAGA